jgi:hypothetical protein
MRLRETRAILKHVGLVDRCLTNGLNVQFRRSRLLKDGKRHSEMESSAFAISNSRPNADERFVGPCYVKGRQGLFKAYRDSGASVSLVSNAYVNESDYTGEMITVKGIFGPAVQILAAVIQIKSPKFGFDDYVSLKVGVLDTKLLFEVDLFAGNDLCRDGLNLSDVTL